MFDLGNKQSYIGLFLGLVFLVFGGGFLLQDFGFISVLDISLELYVFSIGVCLAGLFLYTTGRSVYSHAMSYSLLLMLFGVLVGLYGLVATVHELGFATLPFVISDRLLYEGLLIVSGCFIFGTSFRH